jgi:hypothetical protein
MSAEDDARFAADEAARLATADMAADVAPAAVADGLTTMLHRGRRWVRIWHQQDRDGGRAGGGLDAPPEIIAQWATIARANHGSLHIRTADDPSRCVDLAEGAVWPLERLAEVSANEGGAWASKCWP